MSVAGLSVLLLLLLLLPAAKSVSQEKHVQFTFEYVNGSLVPVAIQSDTSASDDNSGLSGAIVQAIFLGVLFVIGFALSVLLIAVVLSSITLSRLPFNMLLMNMALACLLECLLNVTISVLYAARVQPWDLSVWICYVNSCLMEALPVLYTFILLLLAADRASALKDPLKYRKSLAPGGSAVCRTRGFLVLGWLLAAASGAALAAGVLQSWPFPVRYSCQVLDENSLYYGIATLVVCYLLPWLVTAYFMAQIHRSLTSERRKERKAARGNGQKVSTHTAFFFANAQLWNELRNVMIVLALLVIYIFCLAPYVVRNKVDQMERDYDYSYYGNLSVPYYQRVNSTSANASSSDTTKVPGHLQEVSEPFLGPIDTVLVWLRYLHALLAPLLVFAIHKDLRKKAKDLLCCWYRPNSVENGQASPRARPVSDYHRKQREMEKLKTKRFKRITNISVPVLFATSDGLHLRTAEASFPIHQSDSSQGGSNKSKALTKGTTTSWSENPQFVMEFCDLQVSQPQQQQQQQQQQPASPDGTFGSTVTLFKDPKALKMERDRHHDVYNDDERLPLIALNRKVQFNSKIEEIPRGETMVDDNEEEENTAAQLRMRKKKQREEEEEKDEHDRRKKKDSSSSVSSRDSVESRKHKSKKKKKKDMEMQQY